MGDGQVSYKLYIARLVLSQPASASICERINSEFAFVKDVRRNRLEHTKASKHQTRGQLVALFHNLRLISRMKKPCYVEPAIGWNNEDERSGVVKYEVAHYEPLQRRAKIDAPARPALLPPPVALVEQELLPMM